LLCKCNGSESIHEQIDHQELHEGERRILISSNGNAYDSHDTEINGQLVLNKLFDIDNHIPALNHCVHEHIQPAPLEYNVGCINGWLGWVYSHFDRHVRLFQHLRFFMEITCDTSRLPNGSHEFDLDEFDFLWAVENAVDVFEVISNILLYFGIDWFSVRCDLFPVFKYFRSRHNLPFHVSFFNKIHVKYTFVVLFLFFTLFFFCQFFWLRNFLFFIFVIFAFELFLGNYVCKFLIAFCYNTYFDVMLR